MLFRSAAIVFAVPGQIVATGILQAFFEAADHLATTIVDLDAYGSCFHQAIADGGTGIEGIGEYVFELGKFRDNGDMMIILAFVNQGNGAMIALAAIQIRDL